MKTLAKEPHVDFSKSFIIAHKHYNYVLSIAESNKSVIAVEKEKVDQNCLWQLLIHNKAAYFQLKHVYSNSLLVYTEDKLALQYSVRNSPQSHWRLHPYNLATCFRFETIYRQLYLACLPQGDLIMKELIISNTDAFDWLIPI